MSRNGRRTSALVGSWFLVPTVLFPQTMGGWGGILVVLTVLFPRMDGNEPR